MPCFMPERALAFADITLNPGHSPIEAEWFRKRFSVTPELIKELYPLFW